MNTNRVLLMTLSERTSGKGNRYWSGWLGKASVVAFPGDPDKWGNPTIDVFVSTPEPKPDAGQERPQAGQEQRPEPMPERRPQNPEREDRRVPTAATPAKPSASPQERGDGWRGSTYRKPVPGARQPPPVVDDAPFFDDDLDDIGRSR